MEIRVSATRMELLKLGRKAMLAKRGHKLLKDKLDGLVQNFIKTSKGLRVLYGELRQGLAKAFAEGAIAAASIDRQAFRAALVYPTLKTSVEEKFANLMGVKTPRYEVNFTGELKCFGGIFFTERFVDSAERFKVLLPEMVKLAELFKTLQRLGQEIAQIKRRVNALEYVLIPSLDSKIRYIKMKLAEMERSTTVSLLKIKEIVRR